MPGPVPRLPVLASGSSAGWFWWSAAGLPCRWPSKSSGSWASLPGNCRAPVPFPLFLPGGRSLSTIELNRAIARVTGDPVLTIQSLGFALDHDEDDHDEACGPTVLDWDDFVPVPLAELDREDDWPGRVSPLPAMTNRE